MTVKKLYSRTGQLQRESHYRAKKSLGQNFLTDANIVRKIIEALQLSESSSVLEIGPGRGALTSMIAESGCTLQAVEKDSDLYAYLSDRLKDTPNVRLIHGDFLQVSFPTSLARMKVVGNIPYNLTSEIVSRVVDERRNIDFAVIMVQEEVAQRLAADVGTKQYGALSVRLQLVAEVEKLFRVSRNCFEPRPNVDSRVVKITFKDRNPLENEKDFVRFVKLAFSMRRKMFRHFTTHFFGKESVALLDPRFLTNRVETFGPADIYSIFKILRNHV